MKRSIFTAELVGTFMLVLFGCGAIIADHSAAAALGNMGIALVFGLIVMAMIYAVGNVSGAHLNPAVSVAFALSGRLGWPRVPLYLSAQLTGALLAALLLNAIYPPHATLGATLPSTTLFGTIAIEVVLTFSLMFVILNVASGHKEKGIMAGVAVGGTVALAAMVGGPLTGASMNPARSFGPAIVSGNIEHLWIYFVAPVVGAALAIPVAKLVQGPRG